MTPFFVKLRNNIGKVVYYLSHVLLALTFSLTSHDVDGVIILF